MGTEGRISSREAARAQLAGSHRSTSASSSHGKREGRMVGESAHATCARTGVSPALRSLPAQNTPNVASRSAALLRRCRTACQERTHPLSSA
eukprot:9316535-Pyramimonas_sp.AAC.2